MAEFGQDLQKDSRKEKNGKRNQGTKKENFCSINRMVTLASRRSRMQIVMTATTIMCAITAMTEHLGSVDNLCVAGLQVAYFSWC